MRHTSVFSKRGLAAPVSIDLIGLTTVQPKQGLVTGFYIVMPQIEICWLQSILGKKPQQLGFVFDGKHQEQIRSAIPSQNIDRLIHWLRDEERGINNNHIKFPVNRLWRPQIIREKLRKFSKLRVDV